MTDHKASWRRLSRPIRKLIAEGQGRQIANRLQYGVEIYGEHYDGTDPLRDVEEELHDGIIYLQWGIRQREYALDMLTNADLTDPNKMRLAITQAIGILQGDPRDNER